MCDRRSNFLVQKKTNHIYTHGMLHSFPVCEHLTTVVAAFTKCSNTCTYVARIKEKLWFIGCSWLQPMQQLFMCVVIVSRYTWTVSYVSLRFVLFGGPFFCSMGNKSQIISFGGSSVSALHQYFTQQNWWVCHKIGDKCFSTRFFFARVLCVCLTFSNKHLYRFETRIG